MIAGLRRAILVTTTTPVGAGGPERLPSATALGANGSRT